MAENFLHRKQRYSCLDKPACAGVPAGVKRNLLPPIFYAFVKRKLRHCTVKSLAYLFKLLPPLPGKTNVDFFLGSMVANIALTVSGI